VIFKFSLLVESQQGKTGKRQSLIISSTDPLLKLSAAIIDLDWSQQLSIENKKPTKPTLEAQSDSTIRDWGRGFPTGY
jgi:hypothetical protein